MTDYERAVEQRLEAVKAKPHARILAIEPHAMKPPPP